MNQSKKSGQVLILVLLVVVVSLGVGLSVASRNLTNLKTSTQAEQSQRAFSAAEGGVENTLSKLNLVAQAISSGTAGSSGCALASGVCTINNTSSAGPGVTSSETVVKGNKTYERLVETGDVAQINLDDILGGSQVVVKWGKSGETSPNVASLEFTFICENDPSTTCITTTKVANAYGQHREAFTVDSIPSQGSGFVQCGNNSASITTLKFTVSDTNPFSCVATVTLPGSGVSNLRLLRVKPFWNRATVNVSSGAASFPTQTYEITSTAVTDSGLSRKVEVKRDALPQLPAVFDYVLYSGKDIIK